MARACREVRRWIEETVEKPIESWVEQTEERCRRRKWYDPRRWFCELITVLVRVVTWVTVTVGKWVTVVVCELIAVAANTVGFIVGLVFAIPIVGRLLRQLWSIVVEAYWRILGLIDTILGLFGMRIPKRLRICVIILRDEEGEQLVDPTALDPAIAEAKRIYHEQANVRLLVDSVRVANGPAPTAVLDTGPCGAGTWVEDIWTPGTYFEWTANVSCFDGAFRRLIGYGAPVVVFVVRDVPGSTEGCSLGPLADYVTIQASNPVCLAHEIGHACGLWHVRGRDNLMFRNCGGTRLRRWQEEILRNSRHVTYL